MIRLKIFFVLEAFFSPLLSSTIFHCYNHLPSAPITIHHQHQRPLSPATLTITQHYVLAPLLFTTLTNTLSLPFSPSLTNHNHLPPSPINTVNHHFPPLSSSIIIYPYYRILLISTNTTNTTTTISHIPLLSMYVLQMIMN